jgi:hypothetical protein
LWLRRYEPAVLLVPLVSWAAPAHVPEGYLLKASIRQCWQRLGWRPDIVVGDLGYIQQQTKKEIRQGWRVAVVTKMKADMKVVKPFDAWDQMSCPHGQPLHWLGYEAVDDLHWFWGGQRPRPVRLLLGSPHLSQRVWVSTRPSRNLAGFAALEHGGGQTSPWTGAILG